MLKCENLINFLESKDISFYAGVPDSILRDLISCLNTIKNVRHLVCPNEGSAIALAIGHHLSTNQIPVVYMQNSGYGNALNPLVSIADSNVYKIPVLIIMGWRGEDNDDEPQHIKQGKITEDLTNLLGLPYCILSSDSSDNYNDINRLILEMKFTKSPAIVLVKKNTFENSIKATTDEEFNLTREKAIEIILSTLLGDEIVVSTTGKCSRELYELRKKFNLGHHTDFLNIGGMGHSSMISLGIAINKPDKKIICLDGDASFLMHMGAISLIGYLNPSNLIHVILNNGSHESVDGPKTNINSIDLKLLSQSCKYSKYYYLSTLECLTEIFPRILRKNELAFVEIKISTSSRKNLIRPDEPPSFLKKVFMEYITQYN